MNTIQVCLSLAQVGLAWMLLWLWALSVNFLEENSFNFFVYQLHSSKLSVADFSSLFSLATISGLDF